MTCLNAAVTMRRYLSLAIRIGRPAHRQRCAIVGEFLQAGGKKLRVSCSCSPLFRMGIGPVARIRLIARTGQIRPVDFSGTSVPCFAGVTINELRRSAPALGIVEYPPGLRHGGLHFVLWAPRHFHRFSRWWLAQLTDSNRAQAPAAAQVLRTRTGFWNYILQQLARQKSIRATFISRLVWISSTVRRSASSPKLCETGRTRERPRAASDPIAGEAIEVPGTGPVVFRHASTSGCAGLNSETDMGMRRTKHAPRSARRRLLETLSPVWRWLRPAQGQKRSNLIRPETTSTTVIIAWIFHFDTFQDA